MSTGAPAHTATVEPRSIIEAVYDDAVHGETLDWLGAGQRRKYLSKSLSALWAKSDAKKPPYGDSGPIDFDITADTNGAELRTFVITVPKQTANRASVSVQLGYSVPSPEGQHVVIYDFRRENGRWKVDEIRTKIWSVRTLLSNWLNQR
ncbi:MAG: hypothetical protein P4L98_04785 [Ancalomicrobiaceae bacterium]|nr:hypothetical protein [Ancalomicrobiaceae bacterium]